MTKRTVFVFLLLVAAKPSSAQITDEELAVLYGGSNPFSNVPEDEWIAQSQNGFVIRDGNPQAPGHFLVIPKEHVPTILQASPELMGELLQLARRVAIEQNLSREGFRIVINTHANGGQSVYQLHIHVLGGRQMGWPPG